MKSDRKQATSKTWSFDRQTSVAFNFLLSKGWFSSISLGLLTTVLGMTGIGSTAKAEELLELSYPELGDEVTAQSQIENISRSALQWINSSAELSPASFSGAELTPPNDANPSSSRVAGSTRSQSKSQTGRQQELETQEPPSSRPLSNLESTEEIAQLSSLFNISAVTGQQSEVQVSSTTPGNKKSPELIETRVIAPGLSTQREEDTVIDSPKADKAEILADTSTGTVSQSPDPPANPSPPLTPNTSEVEPLPSGTVRILTPQTGVLASRSTNLVVQYNADAKIQVNVNQKPLDPSITTEQERDATKNIVTQVWYNIPLEEGENTLTVQAGNGTPVSVQLTVKDTAARKIELTPVGDPRIPADARSTLTISGRVINDKSELIAEDAIVTLTTSAGKFVGADEDKDRAGFQVIARGGQFTARLQSAIEAQKVRIRAAVEEWGGGTPESCKNPVNRASCNRGVGENHPIFNPQFRTAHAAPIEAYSQVEFVTNLRPSLVSGFINLRIGAGGTNFWGRRSDFLNPDKIDDGTRADLTGAVFATGRLGEWLFTGAYNSDRNLNETCDGITRLFRGPQFCEQQYPVYGDSSTTDYLTPSTDSVYLRFERSSPVFGAEPDYVMWGDYNTQEFARDSQLFTATTRQLHGFKGNYSFGNLQLTALYSNDIEGFQRDTIAPNGTSGYYFLSRRIIVEGSENVFLETEENNRPGTVIERKPLRRGADYEIDYDRGTLMFRRPVFQTEFGFFPNPTSEVAPNSVLLVRRIVVTYQYDNAGGNDTNLYGGRLQYNLSQDFNTQSWIAGTYLRQDQGAEDFELYGADFLVSFGARGQLIGEYAHSFNNSLFLGGITGSAYRFEANGRIIPDLDARAYYRSVEENFSNNSTVSFTPGQTRYGGALAYQLGSTTSFRVGYDHEVNFGVAPALRPTLFDLFNPGFEAPPGSRVDNSLTTISAGFLQKIGPATLGVDYVNRSRDDRVSDTFSGDASQIVSRLGLALTESLTFRAQNELNLSGNDPLYPNRTTFGLDWGAYPGVTVRLAHQFFDGGLLGNDSITSLDTILDHKLGDNTTLTGRYSMISAFNGITGQGAVGLNHRWVITPGLRVNLGYEHTFTNSGIPTAAGLRSAQPYTVGQTAAALALLGGDVYSVGLEYTDNPNFQASARFEHRTGAGNDNTVYWLAAAGKLSPALTLLGRYEQANFANQLIEGLGDTATMRVGLAYRDPNSDRWNALMRYEYRQNPSTIPDNLLNSSGTGQEVHFFAGEAIYAPSWRWEFYGKGAVRKSTTFSATSFNNSATVFLSQLRASYRLGYRMDLAVEGRWIGQSEPGASEVGVAVEGGYYLTPDLRVGVGYSFGSVDDRDFSGFRSKGGPYLSVTFKVNELFGGFGRQKVVPPQQQESRTEPVATGDKPTSERTQSVAPVSNTTTTAE